MKSFKQSAFSRFFTRFPKLLLAGLMYSISLAVFTGIFFLISRLTGFNNVIIWGLGIIPSTPFLAGLVMVIRKYAIEKLDVPIIRTFFTAVKENLKTFILHGVITYVIVACSFFAILYYYTLSTDDPVFGSVLTLYLLFTALLLVMMFYVPIMTITYELRTWDIYKNSFLLIFGKILRNLIAFIAVIIVTGMALLALIFSDGAMFWITTGIIVILYPLIFCYIVNSIIAKGLQESVGPFVGINSDIELTEADMEHEKEIVANTDSTSDYIFVNGKMVKNTAKNKDEDK
ncbi:MAG: DUF624 domain-containing protein [Ruminococcus sp.]|nr:DUF624 domain-containing protein [Ruminococcus sp.]